MEGGKKAREVKGLKEGGKGEEERAMRGMGGEDPLLPAQEEEQIVQGHANPNSSFFPTSCHVGVGRRWGLEGYGGKAKGKLLRNKGETEGSKQRLTM